MSSRIALPAAARLNLSRWMGRISGGIAIAGSLLLLVALRMEWISILPASAEIATVGAEPPALASIHLPADKLATADLHLKPAQMGLVQPTRTVPASITYDAARRLPVNSPVAGVVVDVLVEPGEAISAGQPLAVLSSAEVGLARDEVLRREADLDQARKQAAWQDQIAANVAELVTTLGQRPKLGELEKDTQNKILGDYRERLISAYSKLVLAEAQLSSTDALGDSGALSKRLIEERRSNREVAAALFHGSCETSKFAASQERAKAQSVAEQAERLLAVSRQTLANLLGPNSDMTPVSNQTKLSELVLLSPLSGHLEERSAVESSRVASGGPLFIVADTSVMWVSAEIHEHDWRALDVTRQSEVNVRIPALDGAEMTAKVRFIGSQVSTASRSVPLVAELSNPDGKLKPGMFVWVDAPLALARQALTVPPGAVMRHEGHTFVFVPVGKDEFRRVDVQVGLEMRDRIEILSGLKPGEQVVDRGAFFLKSELLLDREE